jgi:hypothetical protein
MNLRSFQTPVLILTTVCILRIGGRGEEPTKAAADFLSKHERDIESATHPKFGDESDSPPGALMGEVRTEWVAPFVLATHYTNVEGQATNVRWYDAEGQIIQQLSGPQIQARTDFVSEKAPDGLVIHGLESLWAVYVPDRKKFAFTGIPKSPVGDIFIDQHAAATKGMQVDVYVRGELVESAGPFPWNAEGNARLDATGRTSFITWKTEERKVAQAVVLGQDGKIRLRVDCGEDAMDPFPLANDKAVLVKMLVVGESHTWFRTLAPEKKPVDLDLENRAAPLAAVPGEDLVLFRTEWTEADDTVEHFVLLHGETGQILWDVVSPVRRDDLPSQAVVFQKRIFVLGRDIAEVDVRTGKCLAVWKARRVPLVAPSFFVRGNELYVGTGGSMYRLSLDDIAARRNGWQ